MRSFSGNKTPRIIADNIDRILMEKYYNHCNFSLNHRLGSISLTMEDRKTQNLHLSLDSKVKTDRFSSNAHISTSNGAFGTMSVFNGIFKASVGGSTPVYTTLRVPDVAKNMVALRGKYYHDLFSASVCAGVDHNNSFATELKFESDVIDFSLKFSVMPEYNVIEGGFLSEYGPYSFLKFNLSAIRPIDIELGWMKVWNNGSGFLGINLPAADINYGITLDLKNNVSVCAAGKFEKSLNRVDLKCGLRVERGAAFNAQIDLMGNMKMKMEFRPKDWVNVTLFSSTCARTKFNPVNFGWSLEFGKQ